MRCDVLIVAAFECPFQDDSLLQQALEPIIEGYEWNDLEFIFSNKTTKQNKKINFWRNFRNAKISLLKRRGLLFSLILFNILIILKSIYYKTKSKKVLIHSRGYPAALAALILSKLKISEYVFDPRGTLSEELTNEEKNKKVFKSIINILERSFLYNSILNVYVSQKMREHYEGKHRITSPFTIIYNRAGNDFILPDVKTFKEFPVLTYIGGVSKYQNLEKIIEILYHVEKIIPSAKIIIGVPSSAIQKIENMCRDFNKKPLVKTFDRESVIQILSSSHYGFLIRDSSIINLVSSPIKFGEYISCGVKVIMTNSIGDYSEMANNDVSLIVDKNSNSEDIAKLIVEDFKLYEYKKQSFYEIAQKLNIKYVSQ